MKITSISTHICNAGMRNWIFVRVDTDQPGIVGWGEATLEWKTRAVVGAVDDLAPLLIGADPRQIEQRYQAMTKHGFWRLGVVGMSAVSGVEIALWDILGKSLGCPVWQLLGGKTREWLRSYTHLGMGDMSAVYGNSLSDKISDSAQQVVDAGYDAIKIVCVPYTHYLADFASLNALDTFMGSVRDAVGDKIDIMVDFHGRPASAMAAKQYIDVIKPYKPMFVEEPVPPEDIAGHIALTREASVPIASGERLIGQREFMPAINARAFHIAQPDIVHTGGLWEAKKIAAHAEIAGIGLAPHNPLGPIAGVAALHFGISTPNVIIQEEMVGAVAWFDEVVDWPIKREPGKWGLPTAPGLGITVNEEVIAKHPFVQEPFPTRDAVGRDGTILDW